MCSKANNFVWSHTLNSFFYCLDIFTKQKFRWTCHLNFCQSQVIYSNLTGSFHKCKHLSLLFHSPSFYSLSHYDFGTGVSGATADFRLSFAFVNCYCFNQIKILFLLRIPQSTLLFSLLPLTPTLCAASFERFYFARFVCPHWHTVICLTWPEFG